MNILLFGSTASNICSGLSPALKILGLVFVALRVAVPIILIVVALFGFVAAIASKDDSNVKESMQKVLTKATSAIAIFLVFTIVKTVVNIVSPASEDNCTACIFDISKCTNLEFRKNTGINIGGSSSDGGSTPSVVNGLRINSVIQKNSIITIKASSTEDTVVGYYISKTNSKPSLEDDKWVNKSANTLKVARMPGTYYVFVKDSIGNIAGGKKVSVKLSEILAPKSRTEKNLLNKKLPTFLINKDDSIENLNEFIADSVKSAGLFTNEGVVTAGLSLINYLYYNYKVQIPYISNVNCFSTRYNILFGVNPDIGKKIDDKLIESQSDKCKGSYGGFDCASFVGWAIHNGGFQSNYTSAGYASKGNGKIINICDVEDSELPKNKECPLMKPKSEAFSAYNKIVPGDLLQSAGHVIMVLHNDTKSKKMYIYEGTTPVGIDTLTYDDIYSKWKYYKLVQMAGYYKNPSNYACLSLSKRGVVARDTFPQSWQDVIDKFSSSSCFYKND